MDTEEAVDYVRRRVRNVGLWTPHDSDTLEDLVSTGFAKWSQDPEPKASFESELDALATALEKGVVQAHARELPGAQYVEPPSWVAAARRFICPWYPWCD